MTNNGPILTGCSVLPPMEPAPEPTAQRKQNGQHGKAAGRFSVLNTFIDVTAGELSRSEIVVWLVLYRDTKDGVARTAQADIARRAGIDPRTVRRAISRLQRQKLVSIVHRGGLRQGLSTYRVHPLGET